MARRSGADDPRLLQRVARYQARGLSANQALAAEKRAGRGMRRQAWLSLYGDVRERVGTGELRAGPAPTKTWQVKEPRGYVAFVVVLTTPKDRSNVIEERVVMVGPYQRKISERRALREAAGLFQRSQRRYPTRVVGMYVSSFARTVKREGD